jgi:hypothetical protein
MTTESRAVRIVLALLAVLVIVSLIFTIVQAY